MLAATDRPRRRGTRRRGPDQGCSNAPVLPRGPCFVRSPIRCADQASRSPTDSHGAHAVTDVFARNDEVMIRLMPSAHGLSVSQWSTATRVEPGAQVDFHPLHELAREALQVPELGGVFRRDACRSPSTVSSHWARSWSSSTIRMRCCFRASIFVGRCRVDLALFGARPPSFSTVCLAPKRDPDLPDDQHSVDRRRLSP